MKLDLDDLERKAREASTPDEWQWHRDDLTGERCLEAKNTGEIVMFADGDSDIGLVVSDGDREHIAAASPPVVLALIAENRHLERIAKAATAFVDEQGKIATRELLERPDFATSAWEYLVAAVPEGGR